LLKSIALFVSRAQKRLVTPSHGLDYLILFILAALPIGLSHAFGMARTRTQTLPTQSGVETLACAGYWDRSNWTSYIVLLPAALFVVRVCADRLFRLSAKTAGHAIVSDLSATKDSTSFHAVLFDSRNLLAALAITLALHVVDMRWQWYYFWHSHDPLWLPRKAPEPLWDWTAWFLTKPHDIRLMYYNLILVLSAYALQFLIVLFAMSLIIAVLRHNLYYLSRIYLRSRPGSGDTTSFIVLNFKDPDGRFGMNRLSTRFNFQIWLLTFAGSFTVLSRLANAQTGPLDNFISNLSVKELISPEKFVDAFLMHLEPLFPTAGQGLFAGIWLVMFIIVLIPARAKLLPLHYGKRSASDYLLEFIPPGSTLDTENKGLSTKADVDVVAHMFAEQSFWPVGDNYAEFLSIGAFIVFFVILAPVPPNSVKHIVYWVALLGVAYSCSKLLFWYFRYRLRSIDDRLVSIPNPKDKN
jgi:hypothetical protein